MTVRRHRHRDRDLRQALDLIEAAFGPVTIVASRPTPPDQRPRAATAASSNPNGHRPDPAQGAGQRAERDGQTSLDLTATVSTATVSAAAPSAVACSAGEEVRR